jgi:DNA mismatch repair ATPase MutS
MDQVAFHFVTFSSTPGKTTFIKQVSIAQLCPLISSLKTALAIILAQIGCYVPARKSIIPIRDRILSRVEPPLSLSYGNRLGLKMIQKTI